MDEQGLEAASGVEQAIGEYTGVHLRAVEDTVEKLALYTAGERRVEVEDVEQCVLAVREAVVFDLLDAIGERQAGKALGILESLSSQRSESLRLNAMLANQLRRLVRIRSHGRRLPSRDTVVSELGIHPFQAGKLLSQVRNFTMADLERALAASAEFNVQTKRTRVAPERLMEAMVLGIILGP